MEGAATSQQLRVVSQGAMSRSTRHRQPWFREACQQTVSTARENTPAPAHPGQPSTSCSLADATFFCHCRSSHTAAMCAQTRTQAACLSYRVDAATAEQMSGIMPSSNAFIATTLRPKGIELPCETSCRLLQLLDEPATSAVELDNPATAAKYPFASEMDTSETTQIRRPFLRRNHQVSLVKHSPMKTGVFVGFMHGADLRADPEPRTAGVSAAVLCLELPGPGKP